MLFCRFQSFSFQVAIASGCWSARQCHAASGEPSRNCGTRSPRKHLRPHFATGLRYAFDVVGNLCCASIFRARIRSCVKLADFAVDVSRRPQRWRMIYPSQSLLHRALLAMTSEFAYSPVLMFSSLDPREIDHATRFAALLIFLISNLRFVSLQRDERR